MPTTTNSLLPYPALSAAPNVPADIQALADRLEVLLAAAGRGKLSGGYAQAVTNQSGITTEVDLTSLTVTVTVGSGRRIRIVGSVYVSGGTGDTCKLKIMEGATQLQERQLMFSGGNAVALDATVSITPTAAAHTYKLTLTRSAGAAGTIVSNASATSPAFILVEDIGI